MGNEDVVSLSAAVRLFRPQCPGCTPTKLLSEGARPCSFYDCPGLPRELAVTCELCMYDFAAGDGTIVCDHNTCPTAVRLKKNVPAYRAWIRLLETETLASGRP